MIAPLCIENGWMWSAWQSERGMPFNSYFFATAQGGVAIDPLPLEAADLERLRDFGGVRRIIVSNRDHTRDAQTLAQAFGAEIVDQAADKEELFPGAFAARIEHGKSDEFAIHLPWHKTAIVGDALIGVPAGRVSLLPDEKLQNPLKLLDSLRRVWALELKNLLPGDGYPIFGNADGAIADLFAARLGAQAFRINVDELAFTPYRFHEDYGAIDAEVGLLIGARKMGYRVADIPPGSSFCPLHWHMEEEEFFYVLSGHPSVRMLSGTVECRPGDFIAFPVGERGAHKLFNPSTEMARVMLVGLYAPHETCFYPDSNKVLTDTRDGFSLMVRSEPVLEYFDGE